MDRDEGQIALIEWQADQICLLLVLFGSASISEGREVEAEGARRDQTLNRPNN